MKVWTFLNVILPFLIIQDIYKVLNPLISLVLSCLGFLQRLILNLLLPFLKNVIWIFLQILISFKLFLVIFYLVVVKV
ncbi:hypothetical protein C1646_700394 [Rhizophagus diaphanus]|nr:hypothetical protein C1646_700394 [Rhizophagus diaphanus] [Rhizophagus sp. MUCL 43196]